MVSDRLQHKYLHNCEEEELPASSTLTTLNQGYQRIPSEEPILQNKGRGISALNDDGTDTDHSIDKPLHLRKKTKDEPARKIVHQKLQAMKEDTDYENDSFEKEPTREWEVEDDADDDFNLPKNHHQNRTVSNENNPISDLKK